MNLIMGIVKNYQFPHCCLQSKVTKSNLSLNLDILENTFITLICFLLRFIFTVHSWEWHRYSHRTLGKKKKYLYFLTTFQHANWWLSLNFTGHKCDFPPALNVQKSCEDLGIQEPLEGCLMSNVSRKGHTLYLLLFAMSVCSTVCVPSSTYFASICEAWKSETQGGLLRKYTSVCRNKHTLTPVCRWRLFASMPARMAAALTTARLWALIATPVPTP